MRQAIELCTKTADGLRQLSPEGVVACRVMANKFKEALASGYIDIAKIIVRTDRIAELKRATKQDVDAYLDAIEMVIKHIESKRPPRTSGGSSCVAEGTAGEKLTAGDAVYRDPTDDKIRKYPPPSEIAMQAACAAYEVLYDAARHNIGILSVDRVPDEISIPLARIIDEYTHVGELMAICQEILHARVFKKPCYCDSREILGSCVPCRIRTVIREIKDDAAAPISEPEARRQEHDCPIGTTGTDTMPARKPPGPATTGSMRSN